MNDNEGNVITFAKSGAPKSPSGDNIKIDITLEDDGTLTWTQTGAASDIEIVGLLEIVKSAIISREYHDEDDCA